MAICHKISNTTKTLTACITLLKTGSPRADNATHTLQTK